MQHGCLLNATGLSKEVLSLCHQGLLEGRDMHEKKSEGNSKMGRKIADQWSSLSTDVPPLDLAGF